MHLIGNRVEQAHTRADDDRMDHQGELIEQRRLSPITCPP
jgi:hypothetical protein